MRSGLPVRERILDAAVEMASTHGIARLSVGDVARRAGLSRQTVYKHFSSKQVLVAETVRREATDIIRQVVDASEEFSDNVRGLSAGIATALRLTRVHPLLDRLIRTEPESLLPLLTSADGPVISVARAAVAGVIEARFPDQASDRRWQAADVIARLLVSYAAGPPDEPPEVLAATLTEFLTQGMLPSLLPT
jgi:AcrR family transcriptional regulator